MSSRLRRESEFAISFIMKTPHNTNRDERLAEALRANLRRRKAAPPVTKPDASEPPAST
jgi:hypothetical protein